MTNASFGQSMGTVGNALAAMSQAQRASGMTPMMDTNAFLQPEAAAMQGTNRANLDNVPLLQQGIGQMADRDRAQAHIAAQDRLSQLDMRNADFQAQLAGQQSGYAHDRQMAQLQEQYAKQNDARNYGYQTKLGQSNSNSTASATGPYSAYGLTQGDVTQAHKLPEYGRFSQFITSGQADPHMIQVELAGKPGLLAVLQSENHDFFAPKKK
jgi:hypothetical protein